MPEKGLLQELSAGAGYLHAGAGAFFRTPSLWGYALIPMGIIFGLYALLMLGLVAWVIPWLAGLLPDPAAWSVWARWLIYAARVLIGVTAVAAALLTGAFLLCTLYEALGALFFDGLVMKFEKMRYGVEHAPLPLRDSLRYMAQSAGYSAVTALLSILLFFPAFFIPVAGIVPAVLIVGYRFGLTYTFSSAFAERAGVREVRVMAARNRRLMLGFGAVGYLWLLIPFSAVVLLPCFALGGAMIYRERLRGEGSRSSEFS
ncbi:MAG: hypothetical protein HPZ91_19810 [Lentisphaeria bacterium]|nr:hypothetical protein [Lentisphaeria bacterium]